MASPGGKRILGGSFQKVDFAFASRTAVLTTAGFRDVIEDLQKAAGHRDPSTTKLYDRRGYNSEKAASFFATS